MPDLYETIYGEWIATTTEKIKALESSPPNFKIKTLLGEVFKNTILSQGEVMDKVWSLISDRDLALLLTDPNGEVRKYARFEKQRRDIELPR